MPTRSAADRLARHWSQLISVKVSWEYFVVIGMSKSADVLSWLANERAPYCRYFCISVYIHRPQQQTCSCSLVILNRSLLTDVRSVRAENPRIQKVSKWILGIESSVVTTSWNGHVGVCPSVHAHTSTWTIWRKPRSHQWQYPISRKKFEII
jgi:hypothetical protein